MVFAIVTEQTSVLFKTVERNLGLNSSIGFANELIFGLVCGLFCYAKLTSQTNLTV